MGPPIHMGLAHMQFGSMASQVDLVQRPLFSFQIQEQLQGLLQRVYSLPPALKLSALWANSAQLSASAHDAIQVALQHYQAAVSSAAMQPFTDIGELYTFVECFAASKYMSASPSAADIKTDMAVMQSWARDLQAAPATVRHGLICIDVEAASQVMQTKVSEAIVRFAALVSNSLFDQSIQLQVRIAVGSFHAHTKLVHCRYPHMHATMQYA